MVQSRPDSEDTLHLLDRIQTGERGAFDELFARYQPFLLQFVGLRLDSRLRGRVDPSDIVQETQLEAFRQLPSFLQRQPMPFRLWLRKTAQERLRMLERQHLEASRRAVGREIPLPDGSAVQLLNQFTAQTPTPSQLIARGELAQRVRDAIAQLEELDQEILLMRTFEDLSYDEVAYLLDITPAAARKRHGRALLRLHTLLIERGLTESQL
jgi:RNA polymerase sigma-70 factor (ECF subfamily)